MPPKKRVKAAKDREQRKRQARLPEESTEAMGIEPSLEPEQARDDDSLAGYLSDASGAPLTPYAVLLARDAAEDALVAEKRAQQQQRDVEASAKKLDAEMEHELREVQVQLEQLREENVRISARGLKLRAHARAQMRARGSTGVPSRSYFDLLSK